MPKPKDMMTSVDLTVVGKGPWTAQKVKGDDSWEAINPTEFDRIENVFRSQEAAVALVAALNALYRHVTLRNRPDYKVGSVEGSLSRFGGR